MKYFGSNSYIPCQIRFIPVLLRTMILFQILVLDASTVSNRTGSSINALKRYIKKESQFLISRQNMPCEHAEIDTGWYQLPLNIIYILFY